MKLMCQNQPQNWADDILEQTTYFATIFSALGVICQNMYQIIDIDDEIHFIFDCLFYLKNVSWDQVH
jgi:hypothetical protein